MNPIRKKMMARPIHINEGELALCGAIDNGSLVDDFMESECDSCAKVINEGLQAVTAIRLLQSKHKLLPEAALRQWIVAHPDQVIEAVSVIGNSDGINICPAVLIIHRPGKRI